MLSLVHRSNGWISDQSAIAYLEQFVLRAIPTYTKGAYTVAQLRVNFNRVSLGSSEGFPKRLHRMHIRVELSDRGAARLWTEWTSQVKYGRLNVSHMVMKVVSIIYGSELNP